METYEYGQAFFLFLNMEDIDEVFCVKVKNTLGANYDAILEEAYNEAHNHYDSVHFLSEITDDDAIIDCSNTYYTTL